MDQGSVLAAVPMPLLDLQVSQGSTDPRSIAVATLQVAIDQGSVLVAIWNTSLFPEHNQKLISGPSECYYD